MAQTTVVRASALGHLAIASNPESQRCSPSCGSTLNTTEFSKSTRLKSNSKQHRIDSGYCYDANFKPLSGRSQQARFSQRYQTTWNGKHREIGPKFGPPDGLTLYSSRRVVKSPAFGANVVNSLNETARKSNSVRGPAPARFSNGTRSFEGCSPVDEDEFTLSLTSFNILAPIYYRKWEGKRESEEREAWWERNKKIVNMLEEKHSSIICLQEFWLGNPELCALYTSHLHKMGYETFQLARTNNRGDGLLTAIDTSKLRVLDQQDIEFRDCGDRVAQLLRVQCKHLTRGGDHPSEATGDCIVGTEPSCPMEFLLVNTHLLFPHNSNSTLIRLRQVCKILEHLERYKAEQKLPPMPIVLCGDWNGSKRGQVYKFMRSQGFSSSFDTARNFEDETLQQWISHRNHRGNLCGVDFIWLLNPSGQMAPLTADWKAAVFGMIKAKLTKAGLRERDAFHFFQAGSEAREQDVVTLEDFILAMDQLGLTGEDSVGLTKEEVEELLASADADGNGVLDYDEFKSILKTRSMAETYELIKRATGIVEDPATDPPPSPTADVPVHAALFGEVPSPRRPAIPLQYMYTSAAETLKPCGQSAPGGEQRLPHLDLVVRDAFLEPEEMERGTWPDDWNLSDHAPVTSIFAPVLRRPLEPVR